MAREYLEAATCVQRPASTVAEALRQKISQPALFLVGHAIELALKAFLLGRGMSINDLRSKSYGHNLAKLLAESRRRKLGAMVKLSKSELGAVAVLNVCYSAKEFEYAASGQTHLPSYAVVHSVAVKLCKGLKVYCAQIAG